MGSANLDGVDLVLVEHLEVDNPNPWAEVKITTESGATFWVTEAAEGYAHAGLELMFYDPERLRDLARGFEDLADRLEVEVEKSETPEEEAEEAATEPAEPADGEDDEIPAHDDPDALAAAYERHDGVIADAAEEFDLGYHAIRLRMIEHGIHESTSYNTGGEADNDLSEEAVEMFGEPEEGDVENGGGSDYVIDNPDGYLATYRVRDGDGITTANSDVSEALGIGVGDPIAIWVQEDAVHVVGPGGGSPPDDDATQVWSRTGLKPHDRVRINIPWGALEAVGAEPGADVKLFDRGDRVVVRAVDQDGELLGEDYEPDAVGRDDILARQREDSPHKYSTGSEPIRFTDHANVDGQASLDGINVNIPDGVTAESVREAVESGECLTINDVCEWHGIEVGGDGHPRGAMRAILHKLGLYRELQMPEANGDRSAETFGRGADAS